MIEEQELNQDINQNIVQSVSKNQDIIDRDSLLFLMWCYIVLKLVDIITTIIGVKYLNLVEANILGFNVVIILSIVIVFVMLYFILDFRTRDKLFKNHNNYVIMKYFIIFLLIVLFLVDIMKIYHIIITIQ